MLPQMTINEIAYNIDMAHTHLAGGQGMVHLCR